MRSSEQLVYYRNRKKLDQSYRYIALSHLTQNVDCLLCNLALVFIKQNRFKCNGYDHPGITVDIKISPDLLAKPLD